MKKLKSSPGAQSITHFALKFSGYVSNVAEKRPKNIVNAQNISVCNIIIQLKELKSTLDSLINVPPGIIVPPGLFFKIDKPTPLI